MHQSRLCPLALAIIVASGTQSRAEEILHSETIPNITVVGIRSQTSNLESLNLSERRFGPAVDGADLLRQVNGLSLGRFGGRGLEPTLRGQSETRINVLLDGSYLHGGCPNRMDPPTAFAAVNSFERVVVLKGVQTLRYGGGGSGGTLLFERENEPQSAGLSGKLSAGTTSNGLRGDLSVDSAWSGEALYLRFNGQRRSADSYKDGDGNTVRSAWEERSAYLVAGLRLRNADRLELAYETTRTDDSLYPGAGMDAPMDESSQWRLKYRAEDLGPLAMLSLDVYQSDVDHLMDNYSERPLMMPVALRVPSTSNTAGARLVEEWDSDSLGYWTFGLDHQYNHRQATRFMGSSVDNVNTVNAYMWPDARLSQSGVFAEMRYAISDSTTLRSGLRYDRVRADAKDVDLDPPAAMLEGPNALYTRYYGIRHEEPATENNLSGLLRIEHNRGNWTLFAGASQTRRTADASERFLAAANAAPMMRWVGNPGLDPEQHRQLDTGAVWTHKGQRIDLVLFRDDVADYILRDRAHAQPGVLQNDNATIYRNVDARLQGVEASWDWAMSEYWSARAELAYVRAENTDENRAIAQTPPLNGSISLSYTGSNWDAGARMRWSDSQGRIDANPMLGSGLDAGETPGWAVLNLYSRLSLGAGGELRAGVDNLFDRTYAEHLNRGNRDPFYPEPLRVNEPGRTLWARYEYRF
jgi:iron complex outermembrane receptor protein